MPAWSRSPRHRHFDALAALERLAKHRRLGDRQPDVEADADEHGAGEKREAPAEGEELLVAERRDSSRKTPPEKRSRPARRVAETSRTTRACRAARSRPPAAPRRPTRRRARAPDRSGRSPAAAARRGRSWRRSAARRSSPSTRPSSAAPRPASSCGRRDRRSGRTARSRSAARRTRSRTSPAKQACRRRIGLREEQRRKDQHRGGGVNVEVEELDRRADQAGEQDLCRAVDQFWGRGPDVAHRTR